MFALELLARKVLPRWLHGTAWNLYWRSVRPAASLEDVEIYEPEFSDPVFVPIDALREKLLILSKNSFFDQPRTVSETVSELRERGWETNPLDVSKILAKMAFSREFLKNKRDDRSLYFAKEALLAN